MKTAVLVATTTLLMSSIAACESSQTAKEPPPGKETARHFTMQVKTCDSGDKGTDADIFIQFVYDNGSESAEVLCPDQPGNDNEENRDRDGEVGVTKYEWPVIGSTIEIPLDRVTSVRLINDCKGEGEKAGWEVAWVKVFAIDTSAGRRLVPMVDHTGTVQLGCEEGVVRYTDMPGCYQPPGQ